VPEIATHGFTSLGFFNLPDCERGPAIPSKKSAKKKTKKAARPQKPKKTTPLKKPKKAARPQKPTAKLALKAKAVGAPVQDLPFLGNDRAVDIVCACANSTAANLFRTLSQCGVNGNSFQQCVFGEIKSKHYIIGIDLIPDAPSSKLIDVVNVIQNAKRASA
jgi:hypothetical protein